MQVQHAFGIFQHFLYHSLAIAFATKLLLNHNAQFGSSVLRSEVNDIDHANGLAMFALNYQSYLLVGVDVSRGMCNVVVQHIP